MYVAMMTILFRAKNSTVSLNCAVCGNKEHASANNNRICWVFHDKRAAGHLSVAEKMFENYHGPFKFKQLHGTIRREVNEQKNCVYKST